MEGSCQGDGCSGSIRNQNRPDQILPLTFKVVPTGVTTTQSLFAEGPMGERHELDINN